MPAPSSPIRPRSFGGTAIALLAASCLLAGCSLFARPLQPRGDRVDADQIRQLKPGTTTATQAAALLGSPTAKGTFDQNTWLYISAMTRPVIGGTQTVVNQRVLELRFDGRGVLQGVEPLDQKAALRSSIATRTTPSPGTEASLLQQLFGNVGRFSPGLAPQAQAPAGGAPGGL